MDDEEANLPLVTHLSSDIIFDVKMDFTRKSYYVADGHMTKAPSSMTYASVVSHDESFCIILTLAALNGLEVLSSEI